MMAGRTLAAATAVGVAAEWGPMLNSLPYLHRAALPALPGLSGLSTRHHIALTHDDGPGPASTPQFLKVLERHPAMACSQNRHTYLGARYGPARDGNRSSWYCHERRLNGNRRPTAMNGPEREGGRDGDARLATSPAIKVTV